ncbi:MAG: Protein involved in biosynthesis of mitomycin antibiotics/polyketide fumonisin, partial [Chthonomonadales bacterium]|nr:Protein involved in biosynthesis of mitomycin antibiotics/polyketide fumonisin [Chthonomonadales bacterium]
MSIEFQESAIPGRHALTYRTRDGHRNFPVREVEVMGTPEEVQQLVRDG